MVSDEEKQIIRRFMNEMNCPKGFSCLSGRANELCKARDIGSDLYLECLDARSHACSFSMPFGETSFCRCPLRVFLGKRQDIPSAERDRAGREGFDEIGI